MRYSPSKTLGRAVQSLFSLVSLACLWKWRQVQCHSFLWKATKLKRFNFLTARPSVLDGEYPLIGTKSRGFRLRCRNVRVFKIYFWPNLQSNVVALVRLWNCLSNLGWSDDIGNLNSNSPVQLAMSTWNRKCNVANPITPPQLWEPIPANVQKQEQK